MTHCSQWFFSASMGLDVAGRLHMSSWL